MLVFTIVEARNTNVNMANWLQQAQQYTGTTNVTITQQNEAYNDLQTIKSGEKKKSTVPYSSHPSHCGTKSVGENSYCTHPAFCFQSSTANLKWCVGGCFILLLKNLLQH